ncbi:MAG: TIR domain-containing protein, partial [Bradyrhizobium sp.]
ADEDLRDQLEKHLTMLKRQGVIETFHDRRILAGNEVDQSISTELERADVILLLVSPDFLASTYCYDIEMRRALERHRQGETRVIPVILRHCDWHSAPFGNLIATPSDGKPIKAFPDLDEGFLQVAQAIRQALSHRRAPIESSASSARPNQQSIVRRAPGPRSSNLKLPKVVTEADKDRFRDEAFEYIATFFENSLAELADRHPDIEVNFRRIDANQFTATGYKNGKRASWCRVFIEHGVIGNGIAFSFNESIGVGGFNENLNVEADADGMYLRPLNMAIRQTSGRLTFEGGAEHYWEMFIDRL